MSTPSWEFASDADAAIELVNPARPTKKATYASSSPADVDAAVAAAAAALAEWSARNRLARSQALVAIGRSLRERADQLASAMLDEIGKPLADGLGEVGNAANLFDYYAALLVTVTDPTSRSISSGDQLMTRRYPLGIVAAITPWNFPVNLAAVKIAPALAFGNAVVLKPSPQAVRSSRAVLEAIAAAGVLPEGLVTLVLGGGGAVAEQLIRHEHVSAVTFTGSTAVGRQIMVLAAQANIPAQCEMGGNNAVVILADADLDRAVALVTDGAYRMAGQRCTATSRVIVERAVYDEVRSRLIDTTKAVRHGDPGNTDVLVGPLVNAGALETVERQVEAAVAAGATALVGGKRSSDSLGYVYEPTILEVPAAATIAPDEIFGPVLTLYAAQDLDEAIDLVNASPYGLTAAISTSNITAAQRFMDEAEVGAVSVNGTTAGWQYQYGFGGWKDSGAGVPEQGPDAELFYTRPKTLREQWAQR
jgi:acyl-CoA reductase-like NAD-dependent aldehyde dehydrogenase